MACASLFWSPTPMVEARPGPALQAIARALEGLTRCVMPLPWMNRGECAYAKVRLWSSSATLSSPTRPLRTVVGFANSAGGRSVVGEGTILVVDVPLGTRRPHFMTDHGIEHGGYVRSGFDDEAG